MMPNLSHRCSLQQCIMCMNTEVLSTVSIWSYVPVAIIVSPRCAVKPAGLNRGQDVFSPQLNHDQVNSLGAVLLGDTRVRSLCSDLAIAFSLFFLFVLEWYLVCVDFKCTGSWYKLTQNRVSWGDFVQEEAERRGATAAATF